MNKQFLFGMSVVLAIAGILFLTADLVSAYKIPWLFAEVPPTRFDSEGTLSADGRQVVISGPYTCDRRDGMAHFQVSVLQNSTLADTRGETVDPQPCTGQEENFVIEAIPVPDDSPAFEGGLPLSVVLVRHSANVESSVRKLPEAPNSGARLSRSLNNNIRNGWA